MVMKVCKINEPPSIIIYSPLLVSLEEDHYILLAEQAVRTLVEVATPGAWIVEHFTWSE